MTTNWNKVARIERAHELAEQNGWQIADMTESRLRLRRGERESVTFAHWADGVIHVIHAQVATGPVSVSKVERSWNSSIWEPEIARILQAKPASAYTDYPFEMVVSEGEYTQCWETASNYTRHQLVPGVYPVELVGIDYQAVTKQPYYAIAHINTIEIEQFWVNRVLTASSAHSTTSGDPSSILWSAYAYHVATADQYVDGPFMVRRRVL